MMSETQDERALSKGKQVLALLMLESNKSEEVTPLHPLVIPLIYQYHDVFPQERPISLPPIRGIEHQMDLLPGAPLPNKVAYRYNPQETKELQCQVEELIAKGYGRESMTPFRMCWIVGP